MTRLTFNPAELLRDLADEQTYAKAAALEQSGQAQWIADPEVDNVYGLVLIEDGAYTNRALVVLYAQPAVSYGPDFETSDEFETIEVQP